MILNTDTGQIKFFTHFIRRICIFRYDMAIFAVKPNKKIYRHKAEVVTVVGIATSTVKVIK